MGTGRYVIPFGRLRNTDVALVGGKNASLGEMLGELGSGGILVPDGFATTAQAFRDFLRDNGLTERIAQRLNRLDVEDVSALEGAGRQIRAWIEEGTLSSEFLQEIVKHYQWLIGQSSSDISVAVRSSATAEDLPEALPGVLRALTSELAA